VIGETAPDVPEPSMVPVTVRDGSNADLPGIAAIYTHYVLRTTTTFHTEVRTPAAWRQRFDEYVVDGPYELLVAEVDGVVVGYCETLPFRSKPAYFPTLELSIYVAPDGVGGGAGGALITALLDRLSQGPFHRLLSVITLPNDASVAFHERHGFVHRGTLTEAGRKFDHYLDVAYFERALD
jgi:phosphinothricin acetyltransferase